jgi:hypothetical protein
MLWLNVRGEANPQTQLERLVGIQQDCNRAVVHDFDGHVRLKDSGLDANAQPSQSPTKLVVQFPAQLGRRCLYETRPPLPARVAVQCELRNCKCCAARIEQRTIHFPILVREDAEVGNLFGHCGRDGGCILAADSQKNHEPGADFAGDAALHDYSSAADALYDGSHGWRQRRLRA